MHVFTASVRLWDDCLAIKNRLFHCDSKVENGIENLSHRDTCATTFRPLPHFSSYCTPCSHIYPGHVVSLNLDFSGGQSVFQSCERVCARMSTCVCVCVCITVL